MAESTGKHRMYLEIGQKRVFAGAVDWPGWCRSGKNEEAAVQTLLDYGPRYLRVLRSAGLEFQAPGNAASFDIVERLAGNATTDFGAPDAPLSGDQEPVSANELGRLQTILVSCWRAFDEVVRAAEGQQLRKGPRGGGRDLQKMVAHVLESEISYLARLGWKVRRDANGELPERLSSTRQAILQGLESAVRGELPERGPRGGIRWGPRFFGRRVAWHTLDHAWEIEDRTA